MTKMRESPFLFGYLQSQTINQPMIKKLLLSMTVMATSATLAVAAPALPGIKKTIRLADGTQVQVQLRGDEHASWWADAKGNAYIHSMLNAQCSMPNSTADVYVPIDLKAVTAKARERRELVNTTRIQQANSRRRILIGGDHQPYEGEKKGLIILAEFQDVKFEADHTRGL